MKKTKLNRMHLKKRREMEEKLAHRKSLEIADRLFSLSCYKEAKNIMVYLSANGEVLTDIIISNALSKGKNLCAPVCRENFEMDAVRFSSVSELKSGKYGILVPEGSESLDEIKLDLIIVPGCVFGRNKHRIGYGKGYYDRFIAKISKKCKTVGLCYSENLEEKVPFGEFDRQIDIIITENEVII